ncbi:VWA domain-containing protein [Nocardioides sp. GY 10113]|uniref:vWA domain-containing protein n=1 Tax=Nocardioides sp. GY 10113 TaxID=2569761 RepID=UPI0010A82ECB|nr:VWA domain-containing protein [Nocardioides sp. GY 10113]TIC85857.1 VWA domain-containing protein [Nocardioides sp. GY 10113]
MSAATEAPVARQPDEVLLGFTRALRAAGVAVTQDRAHSYLAAAALVGLGDPAALRTAGHATLCASPEDLERHDRVFEEWFRRDLRGPTSRPRDPRRPPPTTLLPEQDGAEGAGEDDRGDPVRAAASEVEVLRHRDIATLDAAERARLALLFSALPVVLPRRSAVRRTPHRRGVVDASRTLRASLRRMGEPARIHRRRRSVRHRRVVLLVDVSGSMSGYVEALLRLAHRMVEAGSAAHGRGAVEVFSVGTRLTRLTRALERRDPDRAIAAAGEAVPDWSGGTRLGETLRAFNDRWGRRGLARGAVVVVVSDGWERGDPRLLGEQVAALRRVAHRVVWVNPHRGKPGYAPVQGGIAAVLPHVDALLAGHSLATFTELLEVVRDA